MNYYKHYELLIKQAQTLSPHERLRRRNPTDPRLTSESIYTEKHHIIPRHAGGTDEVSNLVVLLPEEHVMAHLLRYKGMGERCDMLAVRFCLNGIKGKSNRITPTKKVRSLYATMRSMTAEFRKLHGWQTPEGVERIAKARRGTMPAVDAETGEMIGSVPTDHPKIQSGEWQHHTKGKRMVFDTQEKIQKRVDIQECLSNPTRYVTISRSMKGENNANYRGVDEHTIERLFKVIPLSVVDGEYVQAKLLKENLEKEFSEHKRVSLKWFKPYLGDIKSIVEKYNAETNSNLKYDSYYRSAEQREMASNKQKALKAQRKENVEN